MQKELRKPRACPHESCLLYLFPCYGHHFFTNHSLRYCYFIFDYNKDPAGFPKLFSFKNILDMVQWWKAFSTLMYPLRSPNSCGEMDTRCPPKLLLSSLYSAGQGRKNKTKVSWIKVRTGKDHSPVTIKGKTASVWGKLFDWFPTKSEQDNQK